MAEKWIASAVKHPGSFTKFAKEHHMGVQAAADAVISGRLKADKKTKMRARLAKTFAGMARNQKSTGPATAAHMRASRAEDEWDSG